MPKYTIGGDTFEALGADRSIDVLNLLTWPMEAYERVLAVGAAMDRYFTILISRNDKSRRSERSAYWYRSQQ